MGKTFNAVASITAALINRSKRKKTIREISKANAENRNVLKMGNTTKEEIIPLYTQMGNLIFSGGNEDERNILLIQNCQQNTSIGVPTIIIHEGNHKLEHLIRLKFSGHNYLRIINSSNSFYEPIYRLSDQEIIDILMKATTSDQKIDAIASVYIRAVSKLLRAKGIIPYLRMFSNCPFISLPIVIDQMETSGALTRGDADSIRNDIISCEASRPAVECYFNQICQEADILAWKSNLSRSTSIMECVRRNGILLIDITSCSRKNLLSLVNAELQKCSQEGLQLRVILDVASLSNCDNVMKSLKNASGLVAWTVSCPDIYRFIGSDNVELASWLAMAHRTILFEHGIQSSKRLAVELGEYDYIDVTESKARNHNMGQFGYHFGINSNINTSIKREAIIKPEQIENLKQNEFVLIDNFNSNIGEGVLV